MEIPSPPPPPAPTTYPLAQTATMDPQNYNAAKTFSEKTFDPKILLKQKPSRVDPWAKALAPNSTTCN